MGKFRCEPNHVAPEIGEGGWAGRALSACGWRIKRQLVSNPLPPDVGKQKSQTREKTKGKIVGNAIVKHVPYS